MMKVLKRIQGMDALLKKLPEEYHHWYLFGNILKLHYEQIFDDKNKFEDIPCITMILTDHDYKYKIKVELTNVIGDFSFNILNGFFGGLTIEDKLKDGYEPDKCFLMTSFEQDIYLEIYCDAISVKLIKD